jgi:uracil-DNA glycosylase
MKKVTLLRTGWDSGIPVTVTPHPQGRNKQQKKHATKGEKEREYLHA